MKHTLCTRIYRTLLMCACACPIFAQSDQWGGQPPQFLYGVEQPQPFSAVSNDPAAGFMVHDNCAGVSFLPLATDSIIFENSAVQREKKIVGTTLLGAEFAAGRYIAIDQPYGGVTFFAVPGGSYKSVHALFDIRAFKLESKNWAGSFGFGLRHVDFDDGIVFGVNAYYDCLRQNSKTYNQWGLGFEMLSDCWEFHVNGYLPVGKTHHLISERTQDFLADFFILSRTTEYALRGVEVSVGGRWNLDNFSFYVAPGLYYYNASTIGNFQGVEGTAEVNWKNWIALRVNASYDSKFKGRVQGVLLLTIPLDFSWFNRNRCASPCSSSCCDCCCPCPDCMSPILGLPVRRNDLIFTDDCCTVERNWNNCGLRTD